MTNIPAGIDAEEEETQRRITVLKREIVQRAREVAQLQQRLNDLKGQPTFRRSLKDWLGQSDEDISAEYVRVREQFSQLAKEPTASKEHKMVALSYKLDKLAEELRRRGREV